MKNRWVNKYALRYGVGTVVGAAIAVFLGEQNCIFSQWINGQNWGETALIRAAVGFAFCYIASAPLLVIHVARIFIFGRRPPNPISRISLDQPWRAIVALTPALLAGGYVFLGNSSSLCPNSLSRWACSIFWFVMVAQGQAILCCLFGRAPLFAFYQRLSERRARAEGHFESAEIVGQFSALTPAAVSISELKMLAETLAIAHDKKSGGAELMESYRDLREHGNACAIVVMELLLGLVLLPHFRNWHSCWNSQDAMSFVGVLLFWTLPGALSLYVAAKLEIDFI